MAREPYAVQVIKNNDIKLVVRDPSVSFVLNDIAMSTDSEQSFFWIKCMEFKAYSYPFYRWCFTKILLKNRRTLSCLADQTRTGFEPTSFRLCSISEKFAIIRNSFYIHSTNRYTNLMMRVENLNLDSSISYYHFLTNKLYFYQ